MEEISRITSPRIRVLFFIYKFQKLMSQEIKDTMLAIPTHQREGFLRDNCTSVETDSNHYRELTDEELSEKKQEMIKAMTTLDATKEEAKQTAKFFKTKCDGLSTDIKSALNAINTRSVQVTETLYAFDDQDAGMMSYFNPAGQLIYSRPLRPNERQMSITSQALNKNLGATGTDGE